MAGRERVLDRLDALARRLLPALFVMLAVVTIWVAIADSSRLAELRGEVISAVVYVNNWWQISQHVSYFARFSAPSPSAGGRASATRFFAKGGSIAGGLRSQGFAAAMSRS